MKKIKAIIKGRKFTDKLFGIKERQIKRALEAAKDNAEKQKEDASIAYEKSFADMADDDADYQRIIGQMIKHKQTIIDADNTIAAIEAIKAELESEVPDVDDKD